MIIFDLDGTLADCEHRRHFIDASKNPDYSFRMPHGGCGQSNTSMRWFHNKLDKVFVPDWKAFYEACDKDTPIEPVLSAFIHLTQGDPFNHDVQIWSGRCESVREKTLNWLVNLTGYCEDKQYWDRRLKMRPIGDSTPDDVLKERWLNEYLDSVSIYGKWGHKIAHGKEIQFVFDDRPKVVRMWRRNGIFVFNCAQHNQEF